MSSRAFRRLNRDADVIRISENAQEGETVEEEPEFISVACKKKAPAVNPFALVCHVVYPLLFANDLDLVPVVCRYNYTLWYAVE